MEARNCPRCGKMFTYINTPICKECEKIEDEIFKTVKEYLFDNPGDSITDISNATGVSAKKIIRFVKEGRLEVTRGMSGEVVCESCGNPIRVGRYCETCSTKMNRKMTEMFAAPTQDRSGPKMHYTKRL